MALQRLQGALRFQLRPICPMGWRCCLSDQMARERRVMMILQGYCDEAGNDATSKALVVAGLVSTQTRWENFEIYWRLVLRKYDVDFFHAYEFYQGKKPFRRNTQWRSELQRDIFIQESVVRHARCLGSWRGTCSRPWYWFSSARARWARRSGADTVPTRLFSITRARKMSTASLVRK